VDRYLAIASTSAALVLCAGGCATGGAPLKGWTLCRSELAGVVRAAITEDYQRYLESLPDKESRAILVNGAWQRVRLFGDAQGRRAVVISIQRDDGLFWDDLLIYDAAGERLSAARYPDGRFWRPL
jgi:hypothetical protein